MYDYYDGIRILKDKITKIPIGIEWQMEDGTFKRYYPDDLSAEWFIEFCDSVREEKNLRDRIYRNCIYLDSEELDWKIYRVESNASEKIDLEDYCDFVSFFESKLTEKERIIFRAKMHNPKITTREIARETKISKSTVCEKLALIRQKYLYIATARLL